MSAAERGRKPANDKPAAGEPALFEVPEAGACPSCSGSGEALDGGELIAEIVANAAAVLEAEDPLLVETVAAMFVALAQSEDGLDEAMANELIPQLEAQAGVGVLTLLLAVGSITEGPVAAAAAAAAGRLDEAGIPQPVWARELAEPLTAGDCWRLADSFGLASLLAGTFHRAGRSHAFVISVDHASRGAASEIFLLGGEELPAMLEAMRASAEGTGVELEQESLDPAEFRWYVENALDARAEHDEQALFTATAEVPDDEQEGPPYAVLAVLLRLRTNTLPKSDKPTLSHGQYDAGSPTAADVLATKRTASEPPPGYQLKVSLRGAKPPIWRRLEVPADISLVGLHTVIQIAFGWEDAHLHVFQTPFGDFGSPHPELGVSPAESVTLEQVAELKDKIRYVYDFGDDWEHDILVEKVLDGAAPRTPRCTGGRRATPPEDCGGVWGYAELLEALGDPEHEEHHELLDWLGLDSAAEFDPAAFDPTAVSEALSRLVSV